MSIFDGFPQTKVDIVSPSGERRCSTKGVMSEGQIQIEDVSITIEAGDELRRLLPNGNEEVFVVREPTFYEGDGDIPSFYDVKFTRKGSFPKGAGGHYIHVAGDNARVNLHSIDNSMNVINHGSMFGDLRRAIEGGVADGDERRMMLEAVAQLAVAKSDQDRGRSYQALIAQAANHMTILAPFLGPLAQFVTAAG